MICKNCKHSFEGNFCNNCGQSTKVDKITPSKFITEISESIFQINKGILYTAKELFIRPGASIQEYLQGKRRSHFQPLSYVLLVSTIYFILSKIAGENTWMKDFLSGFSGAAYSSEEGTEIPKIIIWSSENFAYASLLLLPIFSLASILSFNKSGINYLEIIILNSYLSGQQALIYSLFLIPKLFIDDDYFLEIIPFIISISYNFWVFFQFFSKGNRIKNILCTILTYLIYTVLCIGILFIFLKIQNY